MLVRETILLDNVCYELQREHSFETPSGGWISPRSSLLVCPGCQRTWAWMQIGEETTLWPHAAFCSRCPAPRENWLMGPPGSLLFPLGYCIFDEPLLEALPPELLLREFNLHIEWMNTLQNSIDNRYILGHNLAHNNKETV